MKRILFYADAELMKKTAAIRTALRDYELILETGYDESLYGYIAESKFDFIIVVAAPFAYFDSIMRARKNGLKTPVLYLSTLCDQDHPTCPEGSSLWYLYVNTQPDEIAAKAKEILDGLDALNLLKKLS